MKKISVNGYSLEQIHILKILTHEQFEDKSFEEVQECKKMKRHFLKLV